LATHPSNIPAAARQVWDTVKGRYGSADNIKNTLTNDPVGALGDLSTALWGGSLATRGAGALANSARLGEVGKGLSTAATLTNPLNVPMTIARAGVRVIPESVRQPMAETMMDKAVHVPNKDARLGTKSPILQTLIQNRLAPNAAGNRGLSTLLDALTSEKENVLNTAAPVNVDRTPLALEAWNHLQQNSPHFKASPPQTSTADNIITRFMGKPTSPEPPFTSLPEMDSVRKANARIASPMYRREYPQVSPEHQEAYGALASALKNRSEIESTKQGLVFKLPDGKKVNIEDLNKTIGSAVDAKAPLANATSRIGRRQNIGLLELMGMLAAKAGPGVAGGAVTGALTHDPFMALLGGLGVHAINSPVTKANAAFFLGNPRKITDVSKFNQTLNALDALRTLTAKKED
jgi:hypothetical protein